MQCERHWPFTQSCSEGHCVLLTHWLVEPGLHRPDWHVSFAEHCVSVLQPR